MFFLTNLGQRLHSHLNFLCLLNYSSNFRRRWSVPWNFLSHKLIFQLLSVAHECTIKTQSFVLDMRLQATTKTLSPLNGVFLPWRWRFCTCIPLNLRQRPQSECSVNKMNAVPPVDCYWTELLTKAASASRISRTFNLIWTIDGHWLQIIQQCLASLSQTRSGWVSLNLSAQGNDFDDCFVEYCIRVRGSISSLTHSQTGIFSGREKKTKKSEKLKLTRDF